MPIPAGQPRLAGLFPRLCHKVIQKYPRALRNELPAGPCRVHRKLAGDPRTQHPGQRTMIEVGRHHIHRHRRDARAIQRRQQQGACVVYRKHRANLHLYRTTAGLWTPHAPDSAAAMQVFQAQTIVGGQISGLERRSSPFQVSSKGATTYEASTGGECTLSVPANSRVCPLASTCLVNVLQDVAHPAEVGLPGLGE